MRNAVTSFFGTSLFTLAGAVSLLAGCPDRTISEVNPQQGRVETKDIPVSVNRDIDILFLIDDSVSMADKQSNLASNFPNFINVLSTIPGGLPNVHIGVATSDLGAVGADGTSQGGLSGTGGCNTTGGKNGNLQLGMATSTDVMGAFVSDLATAGGTRQTNYTGTLSNVFSKMAQVGALGCGFEQHLEAAKRALSNTTTNNGFLRAPAYLAIIFIQDEDDCSIAHASLLGGDTGSLGTLASFRCTRFGVTCDVGGMTPDQMNSVGTKDQCHSNDSGQYLTKVADYVTFFKGLKPDAPDNVIVAGIAGVTTPFQVANLPPPNQPTGTPFNQLVHSCNYTGAMTTDNPTGIEVADPAVRLSTFLTSFPNRNAFTTVCQKDLTDGLTIIAQLLKTVIGDPCIEGTLAMPIDCQVSDVINPGKANAQETVLPACNADTNPSNIPCWHLVMDAANCPATASHDKLLIERGGAEPAMGTHVVANCVTVAD